MSSSSIHGQPLKPKDLLLSPSLTQEQLTNLLGPYGFRHPERADANLQRMADEPGARRLLAAFIDQLLERLSESADPDLALNYLERFARASLDKTHLFTYLKASPLALALLIKAFGCSPFMAQILIRNPASLYWVTDPHVLRGVRKKRALMHECTMAIQAIGSFQGKLNALRRLKRREILRIGMKDLLALASVEHTVTDLSTLADVIIQCTYHVCVDELRGIYGVPSHPGPVGRRVRTAFAVIGLGKLGGKELNFSSDVDLIYLYESGEGITSGGRAGSASSKISNADYFRRLAHAITSALSEVTNEGYLYRVDLNLRPDGKDGAIAGAFEAYRRYYETRGETWERMAMLKARPVAGDRRFGRQCLLMMERFIDGKPFTRVELDEVKTIKERIDRKVALRGHGRRDVKLGIGGIREIEFFVQAKQIMAGERNASVRQNNTIRALRRLFRCRELSRRDSRVLEDAYRFLRRVEHALQMVEDRQTHTLPASPDDLRRCAMTLGYRETAALGAADQLLRDDRAYAARVNEVFRSLFAGPRERAVFP